MEAGLPDRAQVVIIGGGVVGCSVAYHLAKRGWTDVVLLERNQLTSGTTWHAAGLITTARPTSGMRQVVKRSIEVFETLETDTGLSTGWEPTGTLHLATNADRWEELKRQASVSKHDDIAIDILDLDRTLEMYPLLSGDGLVGSLFYPDDGRGNATDTTMSLARGARQRGVQIFENMPVVGIRHDGRRVSGVDTAAGVDRGRVRDQLRRNVGPSARCACRSSRSVAGAGSLLHRHRGDPRAGPWTAHHQELRRLDVREERGRRPDGRASSNPAATRGSRRASPTAQLSSSFPTTGITSGRSTSSP